jgi:pimeloyl-ACP methyl ester carboxylesterase
MNTEPNPIRLYAAILGESNSETILFLPGFTGSHQVWGKNFQAFSKTFRLVLFDLLGFGSSPKPEISYTLEDHLHAIKNTLDSLEITTTHIVGHSMGSLLALAYTNHFPESVANLVLMSLPCFESESEARETIKKSSLFHRWLAMDTPLAHIVCTIMCFLRPLLMPILPYFVRDVPEVVVKDSLRHTWIFYSNTLRNVIFKARTRQWIESLKSPTLLIHGRKDRIAPIENVRKGIGFMSHARQIELEAGHDIIFMKSQEVAEEIAKFLRQ